jgi:hypothetical protein
MVRIKTEVTNRALAVTMFNATDIQSMYIIDEIRARPLNVLKETNTDYIVKTCSGGKWMVPKSFCESY